MDDESNKESLNEGTEETTVDSTATESTEEVQPQEDTDTSESQEGSEDSDINSSDQKEQTEPQKKSRLDRRIEKLNEKKTGISSTLDRLQTVKQQVENPKRQDALVDSLFSEEEKKTGQVDPQELERRIQQRIEQASSDATRRSLQQIQYNNTINEHIVSSEKIKDKPEFQSERFSQEFERQYELANTIYNPMTGEYTFVPKVSPEEVYSNLKSLVDDQVTRATTKVNKDLQEQASTRPLDPTGQSESSDLSQEDLDRMLWSNPEKVGQYIEKKYSSK